MIILFSVVAFLLINCHGSIVDLVSKKWENDFDNNAWLNSDKTFRLYWTVKNISHVEFGMEAGSQGWLGIGFSPNGGMLHSNILLGWIDENGKAFVENSYTLGGHIQPIKSKYQSLLSNISGTQNGTISRIRFHRLIIPCADTEHSKQITHGTMKIIWAYNNHKPKNHQFQHHQKRGSLSLNILSGKTKPITLPNNTKSFDLVFNNFTIPNVKTTYQCKLLALPKILTENHVVRIHPVISEKNKDIVHHYVAYTCPKQFHNESLIGFETNCFDEKRWDIAGRLRDCKSTAAVYAWAIGGREFYFPEHVGLEVGGNSSDSLEYILLEVHYNNEKLDKGRTDSSGLRMYYTPTLRNNSATMLMIGNNPLGRNGASSASLMIPPKLKRVKNSGFCLSECTQKSFPKTGVKAFANFLHAHLLGIDLRLRHFRNGVELKPIDENFNYDFDYQQMTSFSKEIQILPGDTFMMECFYDSSKQNKSTFAGAGADQEMCLSFLYVYPKVNLGQCLSVPTKEDLLHFYTVAKEKKYYNNKTTTYNASMQGALDLFNEYYGGNLTNVTNVTAMCVGGADELIYYGNSFIPKKYKPYIRNVPKCVTQAPKTTTTTTQKSTKKPTQKENAALVIVTVTSIVVIFIIVVFVVLYCVRKSNTKPENRQSLLE